MDGNDEAIGRKVTFGAVEPVSCVYQDVFLSTGGGCDRYNC